MRHPQRVVDDVLRLRPVTIVPRRATIVSIRTGYTRSRGIATSLAESDTIMAQLSEFEAQLRDWRVSSRLVAGRTWRGGSGLSRAGGERGSRRGGLVPSAAAALSLAAALECRVEDLFRLRRPEIGIPTWAWAPRREPSRYWAAEVGGRGAALPGRVGPRWGSSPHDGGRARGGRCRRGERVDPATDPSSWACCEPGGRPARPPNWRARPGLRLLAFPAAEPGGVDAARPRPWSTPRGVHLSRHDEPGGNAGVVRAEIGPGYTLLRVAPLGGGDRPGARALELASVGAAIGSDLRWIGRENGSRGPSVSRRAPGRTPRSAAPGGPIIAAWAEALRGGWARRGRLPPPWSARKPDSTSSACARRPMTSVSRRGGKTTPGSRPLVQAVALPDLPAVPRRVARGMTAPPRALSSV